jgi:hypothetical protein
MLAGYRSFPFQTTCGQFCPLWHSFVHFGTVFIPLKEKNEAFRKSYNERTDRVLQHNEKTGRD